MLVLSLVKRRLRLIDGPLSPFAEASSGDQVTEAEAAYSTNWPRIGDMAAHTLTKMASSIVGRSRQ
jgi:hypothetical protein